MSDFDDLELDLPSDDDLDIDRMRVSPSKIRLFMEDQALFYFRYVENRRSASSPALFEGSTYHKGIEYALNRKRVDGALPPMGDTTDYLRQFWESNHPDSVLGVPTQPDKFRFIANVFEEAYPVLDTIKPKHLEAYFLKSLPEKSFDIQGYVDCVHTTGDYTTGEIGETFDPATDVIIDFKSKSQAPSTMLGVPQLGNFDMLQLTMYGWCLTQGEVPVNAEIIYIVKTRKPKIIRVPKVITPEQMQTTITTVTRIVESMETGKYLPNYSHWMCREDRCEFWAECHQKF